MFHSASTTEGLPPPLRPVRYREPSHESPPCSALSVVPAPLHQFVCLIGLKALFNHSRMPVIMDSTKCKCNFASLETRVAKPASLNGYKDPHAPALQGYRQLRAIDYLSLHR